MLTILNGNGGDLEDWPFHAGLMISGLILIAVGFFIARRKKTIKKWVKKHKFIELFGVFSTLAGLGMGVKLVGELFDGHINSIHAIFGIITLTLLVVAPFIGQSIFWAVKSDRFKKKVKIIRIIHRWMGRTTTLLVIITITLGVLRLLNLIESGQF